MKKILLIVGLLLFATQQPAFALSSTYIQSQKSVCANYSPNLQRANSCFYDLAIQAKDPFICDEIRWTSNKVACKRSIIFSSSWDFTSLFHQLPFLLLCLLFVYVVWKHPPRLSYLQGGFAGLFVAGLVIWITMSPVDIAKKMQPSTQYITAPIDGLSLHVPTFLVAYGWQVRLIIVHILVYSCVIGLLLQGQKSKTKLALLLFFTALLVTYWQHPALDVLKNLLSSLF